MISVYIRTVPQVAHLVFKWQKDIKEAADKLGTDPQHAMRVASANDARAVANAMFHAEVLPPVIRDLDVAELKPEQIKMMIVELERLQQDPIVFRQRLEEQEMRANRDRETAARDVSRLADERDVALEAGKALDSELRTLIDRWSRAGDHETLACAKDVLELIGPGEEKE